MKKAYVVIQVISGAVYDPDVFNNETDADQRYVELVNEAHDGQATTADEAATICKANEDGNTEILYYVGLTVKGARK